jgi:hypothetical protein
MNIPINLLSYFEQLKIDYIEGQKYCYDPIRKKMLVLTPEEVVRQLIVLYLMQAKGYPANKIKLEMGLKVNDMARRCDILVYDPQFQPYLLIECKSAKVAINDLVFKQIAQYNMTLRVPYLYVSNGLLNFCSFMNYQTASFKFLTAIPNYPDKKV